METLQFGDEIIEYNLERKRIKNSYITVKDGIVTVKVPTKMASQKIEELILKRATWILKNVKNQKNKAQAPKKYIDGEIFKVLGKDVVLNISYENVKKPILKFWANRFLVAIPQHNTEGFIQITEKLINKFYMDLAEKEVEKAMRKMVMKVGLAPNKYTIKNLKSTWGNCSTTGNISINKNVVMYSRHAIEYVCLHELCHLREMNHSKKFWDMVEKHMPDYKIAEQELKN